MSITISVGVTAALLMGLISNSCSIQVAGHSFSGSRQLGWFALGDSAEGPVALK